MSNIKLKTGEGIPPFLEVGEPAFDTQNNKLYIGDNNGQAVEIGNSLDETGAVSSVNGKTGDVKLSLSDIDSFLTTDNNEFEYKQSDSTYFSVGYGGMVAKGEGGSGYSLSVTPSGLSISGNPYCNNDIILNQVNWVDENDQSQGIVTTTHKLSEKANSKDVYTKDEVDSLIASSGGENVLPSSIIINSSTPGSTKQFKITIDDNGTLTATELEGNE